MDNTPSRLINQNDTAVQDSILPLVSRTFAMTIPLLPQSLRLSVTNAYLLCRVADTIEDTSHLPTKKKTVFFRQLVEVVKQENSADSYLLELLPALGSSPPVGELALIKDLACIIRITHSLAEKEIEIITNCVQTMCRGMGEFQAVTEKTGHQSKELLKRYCYYVAGVVGEMLTALFCLHSPAIAEKETALRPLIIPFGEGLQMTNILKDLWDDFEDNRLFLPPPFPSLMATIENKHLPVTTTTIFSQSLNVQIHQTYDCLVEATNYAALIPKEESGIRTFLYLNIAFAFSTLKNISIQYGYYSGNTVKISRSDVTIIRDLISQSINCNEDLATIMKLLRSKKPASITQLRKIKIFRKEN